MKKSQVKTMFVFILALALIISLAYAIGTTLISPSDFSQDSDGFLSQKASCIPTAWDGTTSYNITNATLYSNVDGTWKSNGTLKAPNSKGNDTFLFNFTNIINQTAEGEFQWNVKCFEENASPSTTETNTAFAGNRTIIVNYARPTVVTNSPNDGTYSLNGHEIDVVCTASPSGAWNITSVSLKTNIRSDSNVGGGTGENWTLNQTHAVTNPQLGDVIVANFTINKFGNH